MSVSLKYHLLKIILQVICREAGDRNLRQGSAGGDGDEEGVRAVGSNSHCTDYLC